jgi:arylsulfatase A-like enzyme
MPTPNILVFAIDGLRPSALGAYGNTSFATPQLDRFAAESFLLDCCYAPTCELSGVYRAIWQSAHPLRPPNFPLPVPVRDRERDETLTLDAAQLSLPRLLSARGYETILISDDACQFTDDPASSFGAQVCVATPNAESVSRAHEIAQTELARLFAAACDAIQGRTSLPVVDNFRRDRPRLVWVHSRGMYGPWDAPPYLQESLLDEGDLPALDEVTSPEVELSPASDPDTAFRYHCGYAAQVMVLDTCWAAVMETLAAATPANPWLVVLLGLRGFPLGEHGRIGGVDPRLYGEQMHVPWLMRFPTRQGALTRSPALATHMDLLPTIVDAMDGCATRFQADVDGTSILPLIAHLQAPWRDWLLATNPAGGAAIRTPNWCLRQDAINRPDSTQGLNSPAEGELFVRPDDRWEANDVAKLCPEVVEQLADATSDVARQLCEGHAMPATILPPASAAC